MLNLLGCDIPLGEEQRFDAIVEHMRIDPLLVFDAGCVGTQRRIHLTLRAFATVYARVSMARPGMSAGSCCQPATIAFRVSSAGKARVAGEFRFNYLFCKDTPRWMG